MMATRDDDDRDDREAGDEPVCLAEILAGFELDDELAWLTMWND